MKSILNEVRAAATNAEPRELPHLTHELSAKVATDVDDQLLQAFQRRHRLAISSKADAVRLLLDVVVAFDLGTTFDVDLAQARYKEYFMARQCNEDERRLILELFHDIESVWEVLRPVA